MLRIAGNGPEKRRRKPGPAPKITEEAIQMAEMALSRRIHKGSIKVLLKREFGIEHRSCERVLARARERLLERTDRPKEDHRADAYAFYDSVLRDKNAKVRDKILAQKRIDSLLGLDSPLRLEHTGKDGKAVEVSQTGSFDYAGFAAAAERYLGTTGVREAGDRVSEGDDRQE